MADGSVFSGLIRQQQHYQFPAWIREEHRGSYRFFLQSPRNIGYIVTHMRFLERRHNNIGAIRASIEEADNNFSHANLHLVGNDLPPNTRARIYLGLPDGSTFTGHFL